MHIFSHHIQKTEDQLREILRTYMLQHLQWVQHISRVILKDVTVSLEDYIDTITTPGVPIDFVAIVVLCRAYHFHLAIYTSKGVWATCQQKSITKCLFDVVYNGNFTFTETVKKFKGQEYQGWLDNRLKEGKLPSHARSCLPGEVKLETKLVTLLESIELVNNNMLCEHGKCSQDISLSCLKVR